MFIDELPAQVRHDDTANNVDNHLPLIRKLVWTFIKKQERDRFSFRELMPVAYMAARQAGETFNPDLGFQFATHCRKRVQFGLIGQTADGEPPLRRAGSAPPGLRPMWEDVFPGMQGAEGRPFASAEGCHRPARRQAHHPLGIGVAVARSIDDVRQAFADWGIANQGDRPMPDFVLIVGQLHGTPETKTAKNGFLMLLQGESQKRDVVLFLRGCGGA
jgi:hypothetical protein